MSRSPELQIPKCPDPQNSKFPDFQTPPAPPRDELSDPNLTPLLTHPGIKYVARTLAATKANLRRIEAADDCKGTWAETYRQADVSSKVAMELLFRCNIIPAEEFARSNVPADHVEECLGCKLARMFRVTSLQAFCFPVRRI